MLAVCHVPARMKEQTFELPPLMTNGGKTQRADLQKRALFPAAFPRGWPGERGIFSGCGMMASRLSGNERNPASQMLVSQLVGLVRVSVLVGPTQYLNYPLLSIACIFCNPSSGGLSVPDE